MRTIIAFVVYETPFAPAGGIAAVMRFLPEHVRKAFDGETVALTPMHRSTTLPPGGRLESLGTFEVPFGRSNVPVEVLRFDQGVPWHFLKPLEGGFFEGVQHPYDLPCEDLLRDSLFFGKAVAALTATDIVSRDSREGVEWKLLLQDWEAATTALAFAASRGQRPSMYLALHNSYDMPLKTADLKAVGIRGKAAPRDSVLSRALPIVQETIFTVSEQFALDLVDDPLQSEVMIPHLSGKLRSRLSGVDNGPFDECAVREPVIRAAMAGRFAPLREWKAERKERAVRLFRKLVSSADRPVWGDVDKFIAIDDEPWFVMGGRDDPRQKGYDVAAAAIDAFLRRGGNGQFVLFPLPGSEGFEGLQFLKRLAEVFGDRVIALPFRWPEGFFLVLQGAAFGLMPSLYEPFGMANEFYLNGTAGIGRATGGIIRQIVPVRSGASFNRAVQDRAARVHAVSAPPTGILFREMDGIDSVTNDWRSIGACGYNVGAGHPDRVEARGSIPLFRAMATELRLALSDAARIAERPDEYYPMLAEGIDHIRRGFSWTRAAREYVRQITGSAR